MNKKVKPKLRKNLDLFHLYSVFYPVLKETMIECKYLYKTDTCSSFCTEITTVLPDKNNQRPLLIIIIYSGRHLKRHLENTKLLNDAKVASLRFL